MILSKSILYVNNDIDIKNCTSKTSNVKKWFNFPQILYCYRVIFCTLLTYNNCFGGLFLAGWVIRLGLGLF